MKIAETIEEPIDDLPMASRHQSKRQRRLTAHQRGTNAAAGGLKQLPAPKPAPVAAAPALKPVSHVPVEPKIEEEPAPPVARQIVSESFVESDREDEEPVSSHKRYISSGSSRRMAPGKRIKWRSAILESDIIRQDLSFAFLWATHEAAMQTDGEAKKPAR
jgi:hypothetical protein